MSNILNLPQVPAFAWTTSVDGDWLDSIFFPADANAPPTPLNITGIRFRADFRRNTDGQILLPMDSSNGSILTYGSFGYISFRSLVSLRSPLPVAICTGDLFAIADGYQLNLSEQNGPMSLTIKGDTL